MVRVLLCPVIRTRDNNNVAFSASTELKGITDCFSARYDVLKILEQMSMYREVHFIDLHKMIHYWRKVNISTNKIQNRYSFVKISKRYDSK